MTTEFAYWEDIADDRYQIAAICGVSYEAVRKWAAQGVIPSRSIWPLALYFGEISQAQWEDIVEANRTEIATRTITAEYKIARCQTCGGATVIANAATAGLQRAKFDSAEAHGEEIEYVSDKQLKAIGECRCGGEA